MTKPYTPSKLRNQITQFDNDNLNLQAQKTISKISKPLLPRYTEYNGYTVQVTDRNEYKKMVVKSLVEKLWAEQKQAETSNGTVSLGQTDTHTNHEQHLSGQESPLHCNESLDD